MSANFSAIDLRALASALEVCARPLDFPDLKAWGAETLRRVMAMVNAPAGHLDLYGFGLQMPSEHLGYETGLVDRWARDWRHQDDAIQVFKRAQIVSYTRDSRYRAIGHAWQLAYHRSPVFQELYIPANMHLSAAGIRTVHEGVDAHLHVDALREWSTDEDCRVKALLDCLEPVFRASVQLVSRVGERHWSGLSLLDAADESIAVVNEHGRWLHRTDAFERDLASLPPSARESWEAELLSLAQGVIARIDNTRNMSTDELRQPVTTSRAQLSAHAVLSLNAGKSGVPVVLLRLTKKRRVRLQGQLDKFNLTPRQKEVARLLAQGLSSADIAVQLELSIHTARRHTEAVLRKLRVQSRSAVPKLLWGIREDDY